MIKNKWLALEMTLRIIFFLALTPFWLALLVLVIPKLIWDYIRMKEDEEYRRVHSER